MEIKQLLKNILLISLGAVSRIVPHPANFTAILAVGIFSRNYYIPLLSMVISDLIIGFDSWGMRLTVYGSIALGVFIAKVIGKKPRSNQILGATLASSTLFFIITNYAVWANGSMYTKDLTGLLTCYTLAIPFFKNALMGDVFYTSTLFGIQKLFSLKKFGLKSLIFR